MNYVLTQTIVLLFTITAMLHSAYYTSRRYATLTSNSLNRLNLCYESGGTVRLRWGKYVSRTGEFVAMDAGHRWMDVWLRLKHVCMYVCMYVYTVHTVCCNGHGYKLNFTCSSAQDTSDTSASNKQKIYKTNRVHGRKVPDHQQRGTDLQRLHSSDGISRSK
jgi:hypothetical protein